MHIGVHAAATPERLALVAEPAGDRRTYAELDQRSNQVAQLLRSRGLRRGDTIAVLAENRVEYIEIAWAAQRSGLYYVGVNWHLTAAEAAYIVRDSGAQVLFASNRLEGLADAIVAGTDLASAGRIGLGAGRPGWESYEQLLATQPAAPVPDECEGDFMLYSSGTTGRPKGIRREIPGGPLGTYPHAPEQWLRQELGMTGDDVYLSPAPLYHAAPLAWSIASLRIGAAVVVMERFDAETALDLIERHGVTHAQFVPTMFVRMLKLPESVRTGRDVSSLRHAIHGAAPCPVDVKRAMIDWWGPILYEYYSSTEGMGVTAITSAEWLRKPGSVGRPVVGTPYITDDEGVVLPTGAIGTVWFTGGTPFEYHGDPGKTAATHDSRGGTSVGDLGHLDADGYLYLSDRRTHLIISGGVNIYPREVEDALILHPEVVDVAVVGLPDPEMGERVLAVVQPAGTVQPDAALTDELTRFARTALAAYKVPREVRYVAALPRTPTGKLRKQELRAQMLEEPTARRGEAGT